MQVTITDQNTGDTATMETHDIADTIRPWFVDAPAEVDEAIVELQGAWMTREGDAHGLAEYLGLTVKRA